MTTAMSYLDLDNWKADAIEKGFNVYFNGYDHYVATKFMGADYGSYNIETNVGILCSDPIDYKGVDNV